MDIQLRTAGSISDTQPAAIVNRLFSCFVNIRTIINGTIRIICILVSVPRVINHAPGYSKEKALKQA